MGVVQGLGDGIKWVQDSFGVKNVLGLNGADGCILCTKTH